MFWRLLLAHFFTDFILQSKEGVDNKLRAKTVLVHCSILLLVSILLLISYFEIRLLLMLLIISFLHGVIDFLKAGIVLVTDDKWNWVLFLGDQILHLVSIAYIVYLFYPPNWLYSNLFLEFVSLWEKTHWVKFTAFIILLTAGGSYFTASVCKKFTTNIKTNDSLKDAGLYIGILERIIIAASILTGRLEMIGFLIAAKSIIRHNSGNDQQRAFSEYFLIGTFTSFIWAGIVTYLYLRVLPL